MSKELTRLNKLKEHQKGVLRALEMIAHDIKRPLSSIKALFNVLSKTPEKEVPQIITRFKPDLDRVIEDAARLIQQIGQTGCKSEIIYQKITFAEELDSVIKNQEPRTKNMHIYIKKLELS